MNLDQRSRNRKLATDEHGFERQLTKFAAKKNSEWYDCYTDGPDTASENAGTQTHSSDIVLGNGFCCRLRCCAAVWRNFPIVPVWPDRRLSVFIRVHPW
jgi:hypothetical protein